MTVMSTSSNNSETSVDGLIFGPRNKSNRKSFVLDTSPLQIIGLNPKKQKLSGANNHTKSSDSISQSLQSTKRANCSRSASGSERLRRASLSQSSSRKSLTQKNRQVTKIGNDENRIEEYRKKVKKRVRLLASLSQAKNKNQTNTGNTKKPVVKPKSRKINQRRKSDPGPQIKCKTPNRSSKINGQPGTITDFLEKTRQRVRERYHAKRKEMKRQLDREQEDAATREERLQQAVTSVRLATQRIREHLKQDVEETEEMKLEKEKLELESKERIRKYIELAKQRSMLVQLQARMMKSNSKPFINTNVVASKDGMISFIKPKRKFQYQSVNAYLNKKKQGKAILTYWVNRSRALCQVLQENGWEKYNKNSPVPPDFTYWGAASIADEIYGSLSQLPRRITKTLDNKTDFYVLLIENSPLLPDFIPKTFLTYQEAKEFAVRDKQEWESQHGQHKKHVHTSSASETEKQATNNQDGQTNSDANAQLNSNSESETQDGLNPSEQENNTDTTNADAVNIKQDHDHDQTPAGEIAKQTNDMHIPKYPQYVWFLKKNSAANQVGVYSFTTLEKLKQHYFDKTKVKQPETYVIQREVINPLLFEKRKTTLRIYVLITWDLKVYIYNKGVWVVLTNEYDNRNPDRSVHCDHKIRDAKNGHCDVRRIFDDTDPNYHAIIQQSKNIAFQTLHTIMGKERLNPNNEIGYFHLFGYDILLDANLKAWLIEINHYPSLRQTFSDFGTGDAPVKKRLARDFYYFIVEPFFFKNVTQEEDGNKRENDWNWLKCGAINI